MGFSYFNDKNWVDISREERLFCAHLYLEIKGNESRFINWLNQSKKSRLNFESSELNKDWEIGYEVCLYREFYKVIKNMPIKGTKFPQKRTFDLCLFSEKRIIIIEAKAHQGFKRKQLEKIEEDKIRIPKLFKKPITVNLISISSSEYKTKIKENGLFDLNLTWKELNELYNNEIFDKANSKYKK